MEIKTQIVSVVLWIHAKLIVLTMAMVVVYLIAAGQMDGLVLPVLHALVILLPTI